MWLSPLDQIVRSTNILTPIGTFRTTFVGLGVCRGAVGDTISCCRAGGGRRGEGVGWSFVRGERIAHVETEKKIKRWNRYNIRHSSFT